LGKTKSKPEVSESVKVCSLELEMAQYRAQRLKSKIVPGVVEDILSEEETAGASPREFRTQRTAVLEKDESEHKEIPYPGPAQPELEEKSITQKEEEQDRKVVLKSASQEKIIAVSVKKKKSSRGFSLWGWIKKIIGK
jgi:hypothetical protein